MSTTRQPRVSNTLTRTVISIAALSGCIILGPVHFAFAPEPDSSAPLPATRAQLQQEIRDLNREYEQLRESWHAVLDELERLNLKVKILERQVALIKLHRQETAADLAAAQRRLAEIQRRVESYRHFIAARVLALHRLGPAYTFKLLTSLDKSSDFLRAAYYAAILSKLDRLYLERFRRFLKAQQQEAAALETIQAAYDYQFRDLQRKQRALEAARNRQRRYFEDLQQRGVVYARALQELAMAYHRLDNYVGQSSYEPLLNITLFKGLLPWPVKGPVVRGFGRIRLKETGTFVLSRGIEISVPPRTPVHAVFAGQVRYAGWYSAYGRLVIIDHGHNIYSLYAHNSELKVQVGQVVTKDQIVALSGDSASLRGPVLYFEIREGVNAVDPLAWLKIRTSPPSPPH